MMSENLTLTPLVATALIFAVASAFSSETAAQPSSEEILYTVRFPAPQTHYVEIEAVLPARRQPVEVMMAVWTPGSYLVREYARHVEGLAARGADGRSLAVEKTRKNRWRIDARGADRVTLTYRVYAREMSVRTNWVERGFALLNGAPTFITLAETAVKRPHLVFLELPPEWKSSVTSLPEVPGGAHRYRAEDYDELVDSPILAGNPSLYEFEAGGRKHTLACEGEAGVWDGARAARDLERLVRANEQLWGALPYPKYVFINMITEGSGGLEHRNSTVLMTSRWSTSTRRAYVGWLTLAGHEHFHAWNGKRLRPAELGPFDYENEVYTTSLWIPEGLASYYEHLLARRAGLTTQPELLEGVSADIRQLQTTPGRLQQPVEAASFDAWIKHYRPDENSPNSSISYYTKGAVIGLLLDARIRAATAGTKSLDDVMRLALTRFSGARGLTDADFRHTVHEVAGKDFGAWWTKALETTEELDYSEALEWLGLRFAPVAPPASVAEGTGRAWLGAATRTDNGRLIVSQVRRATPAYEAGLNVDDEILAIGEIRVRPEQLATRLERYRPGQKVSVLLARREQLLRIDVTLGQEPGDAWRLEVRPDATPEQAQRLQAWQAPE